MKIIQKIILILLFMILTTHVFCNSNKNLIDITKINKINISSSLKFYEDKTKEISFEEIKNNSFKEKFKFKKDGSPNFGYSKSVFWAKFETLNTTKEIQDRILQINYPSLDKITVYKKLNNKYIKIKTGDSKPLSSREFDHRTFAFNIKNNPGKNVFFLKFSSTGLVNIPSILWSKSKFKKYRKWDSFLHWFYFGIMISLALFNIYFFISEKEKIHFYFASVVLSLMLYFLTQNGLGLQYFWENTPSLSNITNVIGTTLSVFFALLFTRTFLDVKRFSQKLHFAFSLIIISGIPIVFSVFFINYQTATQLSVIYSFLGITSIILSTFISFIKTKSFVRYYSLTWGIYLMTFLVFVLYFLNIIPREFIPIWFLQYSSTLLVLFISVGIISKLENKKKEKKLALNRLSASEKRYKVLLDNANDGILLIINNKTRYSNTQFQILSNYENSELLEIDIRELFKDKKLVSLKNILENKKKQDENKKIQQETNLLTKNGNSIEVLVSTAIVDFEGEKGILTIVTDISGLRNARKKILAQYDEIESQYNEMEAINEELTITHHELIESNLKIKKEKEQLSAILLSIGDAVIAYNSSGRIEMINTVAETLTGWSKEEAFSMDIHDVVQIKNKISKDIIFLTDKNSIKDTIGIPFVLTTKMGEERVIEVSSSPIVLQGLSTTSVVLAIRDITEKNKLEKEILKISKLDSLSILSGGIAHDFNNLLTAIIGNISIANSIIKNDIGITPILDNINKAALRAENLTRQLLTFSKGGNPILKTSSIVDLVQESAKLILAGSNIKQKIIVLDEIWPVKVDTNQMNQVFNNVIINAIQAMPNGGILNIEISNIENISQEIPLSDGNYVCISFKDEGIGIPEKDLNKIFDPFYTTKKNGSGIGLASSFSIVKKHKGYINVKNNKEKGTTFNIFLKSSIEIIEKKKFIGPIKKTKKGRILIMDDEKFIRDVASKIFTMLGYKTTSVCDGKKAFSEYKKAKEEDNGFKYVIMDLTIPGGIGGKEATKQFLSYDPKAFIIVSSGYSDDLVNSNYKKHGFKEILNKPYSLQDASDLMNKIDRESNE